MALAIAGPSSGAGKTTVTLALLAALKRQGLNVQSFKVGPDYIDPMFHRHVTGRPCRNLDPLLTSEAYVRQCFARHTSDAEYATVEGVMGLFDGVPGVSPPAFATEFIATTATPPDSLTDFASTAHIARLLDLPVLLVIDCSRLSGSVAAIAHGYRSFDPRIKIAGAILNRVGSDRHLELLQDALEPLQLPVLGVLRRQDDISIPDRHLGLLPVAEMTNLKEILDKLAHIGYDAFDWNRLLPLLRTDGKTAALQGDPQTDTHLRLSASPCSSKTKIPIAVARDSAFSFYYQDNLDLLQQLGAELVFWSPLTDTRIPDGVCGLYFGGGFPEVFVRELSASRSAREAVRTAIQSGMPAVAECGGLMYLCQEIADFDGQSWPVAGVLPANAVMGKGLTLGYRHATALQDSPLLSAGQTVCGHEFHRSQLSATPSAPLYQTRRYSQKVPVQPEFEGWRLHRLHASYIHLHWGARPEMPARFLQHCAHFRG
ncbi:cobyrinate a,c-diamide synthase [Kamptonema formosum]|uniref:cobyrinate a,c-diamide synthase n=1 Tax=Kamptonema formosum TaxID=331992 RepID=UPI00034552D6|nr:cobyrinate a,c-diamide synthase [Oscillatoria sp. PCC 10802]